MYMFATSNSSVPEIYTPPSPAEHMDLLYMSQNLLSLTIFLDLIY